MRTTWRKLIGEAMSGAGDTWDDVVALTVGSAEEWDSKSGTHRCPDPRVTTVHDSALDVEFDDGFGCEEGVPFTLWTKRHVYFPAKYDGSEWVACAPRDPCAVAMCHV